MGHSFYFYKAANRELVEINYRLLDHWGSGRMYRVLDAENCVAGASGDGTLRRYSKDEMFWILREFEEMSFFDMTNKYTIGFFSIDEIASFMEKTISNLTL